MPRQVVAISIAAVALAGCAAVTPGFDARPQRFTGLEPTVGTESTATVGSPLLVQYDYTAAPRAIVQQHYERPVGINAIRVAAGTQMLRASVNGGEAWCSSGPAFFALGESRPVCFFTSDGAPVSTDSIGVFTQAYVVNTLAGLSYEVEIPFRIDSLSTGTGFKNELLYQGQDRTGVRLSYREYRGDLSRPSFSQDVSYVLNEGRPTVVTFRQARLEITSANNQHIHYRILSAFR